MLGSIFVIFVVGSTFHSDSRFCVPERSREKRSTPLRVTRAPCSYGHCLNMYATHKLWVKFCSLRYKCTSCSYTIDGVFNFYHSFQYRNFAMHAEDMWYTVVLPSLSTHCVKLHGLQKVPSTSASRASNPQLHKPAEYGFQTSVIGVCGLQRGSLGFVYCCPDLRMQKWV